MWLVVLALAAPVAAQGNAAPVKRLPPAQPTIVRLPSLQENAAGELVIQPNVGVGAPLPAVARAPYAQPVAPAGYARQPGESELPPPPPPSPMGPSFDLPPPKAAPQSAIPEPMVQPQGAFPGTLAEPLFGEIIGGDSLLEGFESTAPYDPVPLVADILLGPARYGRREPGIGRERLRFAPFEIDVSQPQNNIRLRWDATYDLTFPDRSEYFWAKAGGRGPAPERAVDFQEFRFLREIGGDTFSVATEIPIRMVNPEINDNTAGVGDMNVASKVVLLDGRDWQITQITRTTFPIASSRKGLGTGHTSIEPGLLFGYRWNELTHFHSELKMSFPLGGDLMFSGPVLRYGLGFSHLYYENDEFALIQTIEFVNIWMLDGQKTLPPVGLLPPGVRDVNSEGIFNLMPGMRLVWDTGGDLGLIEFGLSGGVGVGSDGWYDGMLRFDTRFAW